MKADPETETSSALVAVRPAEAAPNVWDSVQLQRLWLGVEKREWRSLAVLSASPSIETIHIAELFAQLAWRYRGQPSTVCDLRDLSMRLIDYQAQEMQAQIDGGTRLVVALRSMFENPTATLIAKQTDAVVLCIALGETDLKGAAETIASIGRDRVVGSIVVRLKSKNRLAVRRP